MERNDDIPTKGDQEICINIETKPYKQVIQVTDPGECSGRKKVHIPTIKGQRNVQNKKTTTTFDM